MMTLPVLPDSCCFGDKPIKATAARAVVGVDVGVGVVFAVGAPCIAAGIFGLKMDQKEKLSEPQASFFLSHF